VEEGRLRIASHLWTGALARSAARVGSAKGLKWMSEAINTCWLVGRVLEERDLGRWGSDCAVPAKKNRTARSESEGRLCELSSVFLLFFNASAHLDAVFADDRED
jgi:hypothetical protein